MLVLAALIVLAGTVTCHSAHFIKPCHRNDRACLKLSAQAAVPILAKGIPSLGMKPLDPMDMEEVKANRAGLMMHFTNTKVLGLKHCKVLDLVRATDSTTITLKCSVALKGSYSLGGKLLIVDISGVGPYTIFIHDIVVKVKLNVGEREEQGKRYWTINSWKHSADVTGQVRFNFHNLFNGNVALAKQILDYANQNWHTIFEEVSPPIVTAIVSQISYLSGGCINCHSRGGLEVKSPSLIRESAGPIPGKYQYDLFRVILASFFPLCKLGDDACMLSSAKSSLPILVKGIPELGVGSIDPIHDHIKKKQYTKITCDVTLSGNYEVQGKVLILPVEGNGKYNIDIRGISVKCNFNLTEFEESGVSHWKISDDWSDSYKFKVRDGATFHFENLFNGNKILADPVLELINSNWKDIMEEIAPPIIKAVIVREVEAVNMLYSAVPADDFFVK
nr:uncharacterized protein LOC116769529 [Danaus plexippus plexippus]